MKIYLASTSPRRKQLLRDAGVVFKTLSPKYKETRRPGDEPKVLVRRHALGKALSAAPMIKQGIVISADTIVYFQGKIIGKPKDMKDACQILFLLQGKWHRVYTGMTLLWIQEGETARKKVWVEVTRIKLRSMSPEAIHRYFRRINPLDKAGAYAIQSRAASIVEAFKGSFSNAVGMPMESLNYLIKK